MSREVAVNETRSWFEGLLKQAKERLSEQQQSLRAAKESVSTAQFWLEVEEMRVDTLINILGLMDYGVVAPPEQKGGA